LIEEERGELYSCVSDRSDWNTAGLLLSLGEKSFLSIYRENGSPLPFRERRLSLEISFAEKESPTWKEKKGARFLAFWKKNCSNLKVRGQILEKGKGKRLERLGWGIFYKRGKGFLKTGWPFLWGGCWGKEGNPTFSV